MNNIGKYGRMAMNFLKENSAKRFTELSPTEIEEMFSKVDKDANNRMDILTAQLLKKEPIKDSHNFWETYQHKEQIKRTAEEIMLNELIFVER